LSKKELNSRFEIEKASSGRPFFERLKTALYVLARTTPFRKGGAYWDPVGPHSRGPSAWAGVQERGLQVAPVEGQRTFLEKLLKKIL
jgi:hypothetical protein